MSIFRAEIATDPSFIAMIADDFLDHWRLGRIPLLTGEDKSTWLWLLERGWDMLYVPDVRVITVEHPPTRSFWRSSTQLMLRWFGNMLRASGRAIALGRAGVGLFIWWCLVDQRISIWTPLVGPVAVLLAAVAYSPILLYAYLLWVMVTRLVQALSLLTMRNTIGGLWPILIYYNQVYGALLKTYVLFRLDRQRWTRQNISSKAMVDRQHRILRDLGSACVHGLALLALVSGLAFLSGASDAAFAPPPWPGFSRFTRMQLQIVHEAEVHRQHVRLKIPIVVEIDGTRFNVDDWSMGGFGIETEMSSRQPGERFPVRMIFPFEDFEVSLRLDCQMVYILEDNSRFGCRFLGLSQGQLALFRYLVDAYLSGEIVSGGDILAIAGRDNTAEARINPLSFNPYSEEEAARQARSSAWSDSAS